MTDSPLQRQLMLLKLSHALENHPEFGDTYVPDFRSTQQKWMAEVGAVLKRINLLYGFKYESIKNTSVKYWGPSFNQLCQLILQVIEELKLELELENHDNIGQVYGAGEVYDFYRDLATIIDSANSNIYVVDAYFSAETFTTYLSSGKSNVSIRILAGKYSKDVSKAVELHQKQFQSLIELKKSKEMHDRLIIIDENQPWIVGASIKDAGKKPTYLLPVPPQLAEKKIQTYEAIWESASPINT